MQNIINNLNIFNLKGNNKRVALQVFGKAQLGWDKNVKYKSKYKLFIQ